MKMSTQTLATASARHPWRTLLAWIAVFAAAIVAIVALLGDSLTTDDAPTNNPESERAIAAQIESFPPDPERMQSSDIVVVRSEQHTVDSPEFESFVRSLVDENDVPGLARPRTYLDGDASLVSDDRHATIVPLAIPDEDVAETVIEIVEQADEDAAFAVSVTGDQTLDYDFNLLSQEDLEKGELQFGLPAALIILLLVFGAVVAGLIPLLMAIVSIVIALGLTALLAQPFDLSIFIVNMLTGMGLALGIDYSLFVVSRYREERARGLEKLGRDRGVGRDGKPCSGLQRDSVRGRDVRDAAGAELDHAEPRRGGDSRRHRVGGRRDHPLAGAPRVARRPRQRAADSDHRAAHARVGGHRRALLGRDRAKRAATPGPEPRALDRAARRSRACRSSPSTSGRAASRRCPTASSPSRAFSRSRATSPKRRPIRSRSWSRAVPRERRSRRRSAGCGPTLAADARFGSGDIRLSEDGEVAVLSVPVAGDPSSSEAVAAVRELRSELVPKTFDGTDAEVLVGGTTSENIDYFASVIDPAPLVIGLVLVLTFLLLTVVFRSVVVAGTAVALNLLSVAAAYGLLVLVFQYGVGAELLGFQEVDTIEAWVPLFLFSVLFGLSMDYQVFLLSRIQERYRERGDTTDAIIFGVGSTARIITGAALIIVAVFSGFARGDLVMFQQMGFGVAVALLIDATIIRSVLLPSVMSLLGDWNWYLPRWLEWLPRLEVEGPSQPAGGSQARWSRARTSNKPAPIRPQDMSQGQTLGHVRHGLVGRGRAGRPTPA